MTDQPADDAVASARLLVAYVSEDEELHHVRDAATEIGRRSGAKVILYDRDSASAFSDPMPNQWASQAEGAQFGDPLSDQELVKLGREPFAAKVAAAREAAVDAWGWLASDHGTDAVVAYARDHGADLILLPADLEEPGLAERLKGETDDNAVEEANESAAGLAVVLVAPDGATERATGRLSRQGRLRVDAVARYRSRRQPISPPWWASWSTIAHSTRQAGQRLPQLVHLSVSSPSSSSPASTSRSRRWPASSRATAPAAVAGAGRSGKVSARWPKAHSWYITLQSARWTRRQPMVVNGAGSGSGSA